MVRKDSERRGLISWHAFLLMAVVAAFLAYSEWTKPSSPPFSGRGAILRRLVFEIFGQEGLFGLLLSAAFLLVGYSFHLWRREQKGKSA